MRACLLLENTAGNEILFELLILWIPVNDFADGVALICFQLEDGILMK